MGADIGKIFICAIFLALGNFLPAQTIHDTAKCRVLLEHGEDIYLVKPDSAVILWNSVIGLIERNLNSLNGSKGNLKNTFLKYEAQVLSNLGYIYESKGDIASALKYFEKSL
ncbi:MAG TPA: tetratricopeptide repeat protein, partial [Bacteroidia bacterium]|nr:tetratricopeptide repeat protein [Bacteroidia bacterium]